MSGVARNGRASSLDAAGSDGGVGFGASTSTVTPGSENGAAGGNSARAAASGAKVLHMVRAGASTRSAVAAAYDAEQAQRSPGAAATGTRDAAQDAFADCSAYALPVGSDGSTYDDQHTQLQYNVSIVDVLPRDAYHFYSVCVVPHKLDQVLTVRLESKSGDADLYVGGR